MQPSWIVPLTLCLAGAARGPLDVRLVRLAIPAISLSAVETSVAAAAPALRTAPSQPRQGQAVFVSAAGLPASARAAMTWDGKQYPIYFLGPEWRGVVPLKIEERPGAHRFRLTYTDAAGRRRAMLREVLVGRTPVRTERLSMSRGTEKLYSYPGRAKELASVRRALWSETAHQFWSGDFILPARGRLATPFGVKRIRNGRPVGYHRGLDVAAPAGTPVHAAGAGHVVLARTLKMHGKTVVIDHGLGVTSIYLHQSGLHCREGQEVRRGDLIGEVGMTGVATGPHLHWGVYVHGTAVSPLFWTRLPR